MAKETLRCIAKPAFDFEDYIVKRFEILTRRVMRMFLEAELGDNHLSFVTILYYYRCETLLTPF